MTENNVLNQKKALSAEVGEDIGYELGVKMVKDYYDATGDKSAHFVGKNILIKILSQPDCMGIRIYKALNEQGAQTYVMVGMNSKAEPILEYPIVTIDGQLSKELGIVADRKASDLNWVNLV